MHAPLPTTPEDVESAWVRLVHVLALSARRDARFAAELRQGRTEFGLAEAAPSAAVAEAETASGAERRLLEWFALERPSAALQGVPQEALAAELRQSASEPEQRGAAALLASLASVFAVEGAVEGEGVRVRDLLTGASYALSEARAALEFEAGDLIAGRIYPLGGGLHCASPAATCARHPELRGALERDLANLRGQRRGPLRITQLELERMFYAPIAAAQKAAAQRAPVPDAQAVLEAARVGLVRQGLEAEQVEELLEALSSAPLPAGPAPLGANDVLGELLNELAFESAVDLEQARIWLSNAWIALAGARALEEADDDEADARDENDEADGIDAPSRARAKSERSAARALDAARALAEFDAARAAGGDLEQLFDRLESQLGLSDEREEEPELEELSEPGIVRALVEEYLWERARSEDALPEAQRAAVLELAEALQAWPSLESVGGDEYVGLVAVRLLEREPPPRPAECNDVLVAAEGFARWCEAEQDHALWSAIDERFSGLRESLPRCARANLTLRAAALEGPGAPLRGSERTALHAIESSEASGAVKLRGAFELHVAPELARDLRAGDWIASTGSARARRALRIYPPEAAAMLARLERSED
jgi:hypothetical protein